MGRLRDQGIAVLNGLVGDYLAEADNGLATELALYHGGRALPLTSEALAEAHPEASGRLLVLVHGLMVDESCFLFPDGSDYGSRLQEALGLDPYYLRYNSGRPIADNGAAFARLLARLVDVHPVPVQELILVGYSMGGLLVRSACHVAAAEALPWLSLVRTAVYLGTPHLGAPGERWGGLLSRVLRSVPDPTTRLIGDITELRSAGIRDLGHAALREVDRARPGQGVSLRDAKHPVPLLPGIRHALVAGSLQMPPPVAALFGDAVVPLGSATGATLVDPSSLDIERDRVEVLQGRTHFDLCHDEEAFALLRAWCAPHRARDEARDEATEEAAP